MQEEQRYQQLTREVEDFFNQPRWENIVRNYTPRDVAILRPSIPTTTIAHHQSVKLWNLLKEAQAQNTQHITFGALDPIQVINLSKYAKTIYVSGWQCSSTASTTNEPGPDFADYPYNTVPNKVDQLVKAQIFHDRKQNEERSKLTEQKRQQTPRWDYLSPIIADADAGFGGITSVMKLTKMFIEAGAGGIHMEDQRAGVKKCGHMGGKVLVATREHSQRLQAIRLQADILACPLVLVARTDALSATFIDSNIDPVDHPYILGQVEPGNNKNLMTFPEAGEQEILKRFKHNKQQQEKVLQQWREQSREMSLEEGRQLARNLGFEFYFDWNGSRSSEGYYPVKGSVEFCARRAREFLKYSDLVWMETPKPNYEIAKKFSQLVKQYHPTKMLSYNLSPSFNWSGAGLNDEQIGSFCSELGKLGFVWQFITLAGFHSNALVTEKFAKDFQERAMIAYVEKIQREEEKHKVDQLTHQKWSGANFVDSVVSLITKDHNLSSSNSDSTEHQFSQKPLNLLQNGTVQITFNNGTKPKL